MILGLGIDLVAVERFDPDRWGAGQHVLEEIFTDGELAYCRSMRRPDEFFAVRFAAKEAYFKALGTGKVGAISWRDVEVVRDEKGRPALAVSGEARRVSDGIGVRRIHVSLTHTDDAAAAVVVLED
jgi:holo-[acyl-carrier protein] synthase